MELGEKLKQARLAAGLSQRQLCGDEITRNMLSQIENGAAKPSMATLSYLAGRLGKSVGWFLDEEAEEHSALIEAVTVLKQAEDAIADGRDIYASELLEKVNCEELLRRKLLLKARLPGSDLADICRELPSLDEELHLRAKAALQQGDLERCEHLLEATEDHSSVEFAMIRGKVHLLRQEYREAAEHFHRAEEVYPAETAAKLEQCYRELGDFKQAYFYACKQKK